MNDLSSLHPVAQVAFIVMAGMAVITFIWCLYRS